MLPSSEHMDRVYLERSKDLIGRYFFKCGMTAAQIATELKRTDRLPDGWDVTEVQRYMETLQSREVSSDA